MHTGRHFPCTLLLACFLFQSAFAAISIRVFSRDEGLSESNIAKPRIYIQNIGDEPISNFYCYYYFTAEDNKTPILDDYYTPDASTTLENLNNGNYRVRFDFSGTTLDPGQIKPNPTGKVVGLHYSNWSVWDKTNDFSNTGLATFTLNGNIPVYTSDGTLIYGNEPTDPGNPPQPPKVLTGTHDYAILSKEFTDIRDRVIVKGGDVGSGVYLEVGANAVVNGNVFSCGSMFLRSNDTINGDATAGEDVNTQNGVVVTGTVRSHAQLEIPQLAAYPVSYGTDDVTVADDGTIDLQPGSYKDFHAYSRSTIIMHPGDYFFNKFFLETDVNVILKVSNTERLNLNVNSSLRFGDRTTMSFELGTAYPYSVKIYSAQTGQVFIGNTCQIYGNIICPDAEVHVYSNTNVNGALYGKKVIIEPGSEVCKPPLLQDFWHSEWAYSPSFNPTVFDYKAAVPDATATLTISTVALNGTIVTINGQQSTENTVPLTGTVTGIPILLNNPDNCGTTAYNLEVTKTSNYQIFVNDDSPCLNGMEDGNSWSTAYKDLQQAIDRALVEGKEIWVAEGTYKPTHRVDPGDPRSATFMLKTGIELIGGFNGTESIKNPLGSIYSTVLSGDIEGNDTLISNWPPVSDSDFIALSDNVYHVLTVENYGYAKSQKIRGFTISGGNANLEDTKAIGAGIFTCGKLCDLTECNISGNYAKNSGAGVYCKTAPDSIIQCLFSRNVSLSGKAAGLFIQSGDSTIISSSVFDKNHQLDTIASTGGGALYNGCNDLKIVNSIFTANFSGSNGGALFNNKSKCFIVNCTFAFNASNTGRQSIRNDSGVIDIVNTILWNASNKPETDSSGVTVSYSRITNGFPGIGNSSENPLFVGGSVPTGPDGKYGTADDGLFLSEGSPCINMGITNQNTPLTDIILTEREDTDIGAYEFFKAQNYDKVFGYLDPSGNFVPEEGIHVIDKIWHWWYVSIYAECNYAAVGQVLVEKNKYTKKKNSIYTDLYSLDASGNVISGLSPVRIQLYKVGERDGMLVFQSKTTTQGKSIVFVEDEWYHNWGNNWAYVVCAKSSNFRAVTPNAQF